MNDRLSIAMCIAFLIGCGGGTAQQDQTQAQTSGGEEETPPPMRTTTPVPVPQPAVPRERLSRTLQHLWTQIEETVAIRPPEPPAEASSEAVEAWAQGPFTQWIQQRRQAMQEAETTGRNIRENPTYERAVAAALLGFGLEDFVADARGAPVPDTIAHDPEQLRAYVDNLQSVLRPLALEAVAHYVSCRERLEPLGDDSEWLPWRAYCVQRGQDMIDTYQLTPPEQPDGGEQPSTQ
jgi:hypothetical protein